MSALSARGLGLERQSNGDFTDDDGHTPDPMPAEREGRGSDLEMGQNERNAPLVRTGVSS